MTHILMVITTVAVVTLLLRAFPFLIFRGNATPPPIVLYVGRVIPPASIAMLVIYCLRDIPLKAMPYGIPELSASVLTVLIHLKFRNPLISILIGTAAYMILIQCVFA